MTELSIIWGVGLLMCSMLITWHYNKRPNDRLSFKITVLVLICWPVSLTLVIITLFALWVDIKYFSDEDDTL